MDYKSSCYPLLFRFPGTLLPDAATHMKYTLLPSSSRTPRFWSRCLCLGLSLRSVVDTELRASGVDLPPNHVHTEHTSEEVAL